MDSASLSVPGLRRLGAAPTPLQPGRLGAAAAAGGPGGRAGALGGEDRRILEGGSVQHPS